MPVHKLFKAILEHMARIAWHCQIVTAACLEHFDILCHDGPQLFFPASFDTAGAVGNIRMRPQQNVQMILIFLCFGCLGKLEIEHFTGFRPHPPDDAKCFFHSAFSGLG